MATAIGPKRVCNGSSSLPGVNERTRVIGRTVKFLTVEAEQGEDLNGDLDTDDVVLQAFDARSLPSDPPGLVGNANPTQLTGISMTAAVRTIGAISAGVCTNTGLACATDENCGDGGRCHVPPGACLVDLGRSCTLLPLGDTCERGEFCVPRGDAEAATCRQRLGSCSSDSDCEGESRCHDTGQSFRRLSSPFAASAVGEHVFVGSGRCVEDTGEPCTLLRGPGRACAAGEACRFGDGKSGTCAREHGSCRTAEDCPGVAVCEKRLILAAAADSDEDGVPDPFDNCPSVENFDQEDANDNEV